jgi:hypothetical protein
MGIDPDQIIIDYDSPEPTIEINLDTQPTTASSVKDLWYSEFLPKKGI